VVLICWPVRLAAQAGIEIGGRHAAWALLTLGQTQMRNVDGKSSPTPANPMPLDLAA